jgi:hypothetical protein
VTWIEGKLDEHGIEKVIPDDATLATAFQRASEHAAVQKMIDEAVIELRKTMTVAAVPDNLRALIAERLAIDNTRTWDSVVTEIVEAKKAA